MYYKNDFEPLEGALIRNSEDYTYRHPNYNLASTYLTNIQSFQDVHDGVMETFSDEIENEHKSQLMMELRGVNALKSLYWLVKHHCYTAAYGRVRFLLETYLILRGLNRDKKRAKKKYEKAVKKIRNSEESSNLFNTIYLTEYLSGVRRNEKGELGKVDKSYSDMYDHLSNIGSHPQSITSMSNDGSWTHSQEGDLFRFGLIFVFGLASQYVQTFSNTSAYMDLFQAIDPIFVSVRLTLDSGVPTFMKGDLKYLSPSEYW
ncbi:DUF5677 domain-containing protein [Natrialba sp. PRR66]|uniref:DUF5677 domain-containing protein n=1 Tax=Natrialba sp. PRR66 TaxID=3098146 RepID=UPI002B1D37F5|nr:DUF5677 domain-containing protein [Natrialba sp. PRR66]